MGRIIPYIMDNKKMFQATNQMMFFLKTERCWISFSQAENALNDNFKCSDPVDGQNMTTPAGKYW